MSKNNAEPPALLSEFAEPRSDLEAKRFGEKRNREIGYAEIEKLTRWAREQQARREEEAAACQISLRRAIRCGDVTKVRELQATIRALEAIALDAARLVREIEIFQLPSLVKVYEGPPRSQVALTGEGRV